MEMSDQLPLRLLAPAKLTLTLKMTGRRDDGYHFLESEMVSISLFDEILLDASTQALDIAQISLGDPWLLATRGFAFDSVPLDETNLVLRALRFAGSQARCSIAKRIPPGAGLGGGSADAGAILRHFCPTMTPADSVFLGADVPFCFQIDRAAVGGVGDVVVSVPSRAARFVIFLVPILSPTREVYGAYDELGRSPKRDNDAGPSNDLEEAAIAVSPELAIYRDLIQTWVGRRPSLAGSGSTFFVESTLRDLNLDKSKPIDDLAVELSDGGRTVIAIEVGEVTRSTLKNVSKVAKPEMSSEL